MRAEAVPARAPRRRRAAARRPARPELDQPPYGVGGRLEGAADHTRPGWRCGRCFIRFAKDDLGDPNPPTWAYVFFESHPTLAQRVAMANAWASRNRGG